MGASLTVLAPRDVHHHCLARCGLQVGGQGVLKDALRRAWCPGEKPNNGTLQELAIPHLAKSSQGFSGFCAGPSLTCSATLSARTQRGRGGRRRSPLLGRQITASRFPRERPPPKAPRRSGTPAPLAGSARRTGRKLSNPSRAIASRATRTTGGTPKNLPEEGMRSAMLADRAIAEMESPGSCHAAPGRNLVDRSCVASVAPPLRPAHATTLIAGPATLGQYLRGRRDARREQLQRRV
jgi:hypothetical protein